MKMTQNRWLHTCMHGRGRGGKIGGREARASGAARRTVLCSEHRAPQRPGAAETMVMTLSTRTGPASYFARISMPSLNCGQGGAEKYSAVRGERRASCGCVVAVVVRSCVGVRERELRGARESDIWHEGGKGSYCEGGTQFARARAGRVCWTGVLDGWVGRACTMLAESRCSWRAMSFLIMSWSSTIAKSAV